jgi:hypothetical protein
MNKNLITNGVPISIVDLFEMVEVKYDRCESLLDLHCVFDFLVAQQDKPDQDTLWLERHAVAVLFCHQAQCSHDLRFLNAALKLNDWAFPYYQKPVSKQRLASYVQALNAQEQAIQELLA